MDAFRYHGLSRGREGEFIVLVVEFVTARLNDLTTTETAHTGESILFSLVLCASLDGYSRRAVAQSL